MSDTVLLAVIYAVSPMLMAWVVWKLNRIGKVAEQTHILVNSRMGVQLRYVADLSAWKAKQTGDPADQLAADQAQKLLAEHEGKQAQVDAKS